MGVSRQPKDQKGYVTAFDRRGPLASRHPAGLRVKQSRQDIPQFNCSQERVRRIRLSVLPVLTKGVIEKAEHVGIQLGMGNVQPWLCFDHGDEVLFEILQGNVNRASYPQRIRIPGVAEPMKPPLLAVMRSPGSAGTATSSASRLPWRTVQPLALQTSGARAPPLLIAFTTHRECITCRFPHGSTTTRCP